MEKKKITTVGELRALLADLPDNMRVFVAGYEEGYEYPKISTGEIVHHSTAHEWEGDYRPVEATNEDYIEKGEEALLISRTRGY